jgi:hypothetical protein
MTKIDSSNRISQFKFFKYVVFRDTTLNHMNSIYNNLNTTKIFFRSTFPIHVSFLCFLILRKHRLFNPVSKTFQTASLHQNAKFYLKKNWNTKSFQLVQNTIIFVDFNINLSTCIVYYTCKIRVY